MKEEIRISRFLAAVNHIYEDIKNKEGMNKLPAAMLLTKRVKPVNIVIRC